MAVGAVSQAIYKKKEKKTEMKKVCEATAAAAPLISGPNLAVGEEKGCVVRGPKIPPRGESSRPIFSLPLPSRLLKWQAEGVRPNSAFTVQRNG